MFVAHVSSPVGVPLLGVPRRLVLLFYIYIYIYNNPQLDFFRFSSPTLHLTEKGLSIPVNTFNNPEELEVIG